MFQEEQEGEIDEYGGSASDGSLSSAQEAEIYSKVGPIHAFTAFARAPPCLFIGLLN